MAMDRRPYDRLWERKLGDPGWLSCDGAGRVQYAADVLGNLDLLSSPRILDVGCGRGAAGIRMGRGKGMYGVEISRLAAREAAGRYEVVVLADAGSDYLPFRDRSFDLCLMLDIIEHIPDPRHSLSEAWRVLENEGHLLICTPNILCWRHIRSLVTTRRFPKTSSDPDLYDGGHIHFFTYRDVTDLLRSASFRTVDDIGPMANSALREFREPLVWILARK